MFQRLRRRCVLSLACLLTSLLAATGSSGADDFALLDQALEQADAKAYEGMRLKFVRTKLGPPDVTMSAAFDPSRESGDQWRVLSPALADRSKDQTQAIEILLEQSDADLELIIDSRSASALLADDLQIKSETANDIVYEASVRNLPGAEDMSGPIDPAEIAKHLKAEITIERKPVRVKGLRVFAPKAFKPIFAAKIETLDISMKVGEAWRDGPLAVTHVERVIAGNAFYVNFGEKVQLLFSKFEDAGGH